MKTTSIPLKNSEGVREGEEAGGVEGKPGAKEEETKWTVGGIRSLKAGTVEVYRPESEGEITVTMRCNGRSHRVRSRGTAKGQLQE